ncbi:MAG: tRNA (adenosine(37)-N6)-threonylcarbamoyltransferase complex transferase subunit TsaD [Labilithrix sp.]|nr:tRNA (adenosine(37)-N6)-threonylcarbamoyltransferase complex transferase subunit TsaD [Labilithrix sp.]MCW5810709.1 tRNA (adenosine(37)-N6)-threonylcarbamoyltransferase complex transferase subunit TsaD [Labilithrix sp.]
MLVLGIESSCDETGVAIVDETGRVLADVVQSQVDLHAPYGGVIPELASRDHLKNLGPVLHDALAKAGVGLDRIDGLAVTNRPGLVGALLVGVQAAKGLAWATGIPLVGVDHLVGHLGAVFLRRGAESDGAGASAEEPPAFPFVALLASGGHTAIYRVDGPLAKDVRELGATRDDAAGEAFDKVAKLLGLGYPGGPVIDRLAKKGNASAVPLSLPMGHTRTLEMSFSGIKTQVAAIVREKPPRSEQELADLCASFQSAVTSVLAKKLLAAARAERLRPESPDVRTVVIGGGVAANSELRARVAALAAEHGMRAVLPELASCTDNAAMIAWAGIARLRAGERDGLDLVATSQTALPRTTRKGRGAR